MKSRKEICTDPRARAKKLVAEGKPVEAMEQYVKDINGGVSFVEVERIIEGDITDGNYAVCHGDDKNLILWTTTKKVSDAIILALKERRVFLRPTTTLVYYLDGKCLILPVAKRPPKGGYKKPHWAPVCLYPRPPDTPKKKVAKKKTRR